MDLKLIELARALQGKIVTNDFNLNKVAQLRGVAVLNINELANSLKPVVLPGEIMKVFILKEGKEYNQGVAYLDDGTMVVVDNARKLIGKTIDVVVTSVLQTTAGKMIFGRFVDPSIAAAQGLRRPSATERARPYARRRRSRSREAPRDRRSARAHGRRRQTDERTQGLDRDECAPFALVADGLLSDSRDFRLHDRARHGLARLEPLRSPRLLRARLRAHVVVADSGDDRRERRGDGPRPAARAAGRTSSSRITRASTTSR